MSVYTFVPPHLENYKEFVICERAFSPEECDKILALYQISTGLPATIGASVSADALVRSSKVRWLTWKLEYDWLYQKLSDHVAAANRNHYQFDLMGFLEFLQLTEYQSGDFYDWHVDFGEGEHSLRKMSLVVQLSDSDEYEGGELMLFPDLKMPRTRGTIILFPSYQLHRVNLLSKGMRKSLVGWVSGPPYR